MSPLIVSFAGRAHATDGDNKKDAVKVITVKFFKFNLFFIFLPLIYFLLSNYTLQIILS